MSFSIDNRNKIRLTKGDTATFTVLIETLDHKKYSPQEGDKLKLTVKGDSILLQEEAVVNNGAWTFILSHNKTKNIPEGVYTYDIQLTTASGNPYTVIQESVFEILGEITE